MLASIGKQSEESVRQEVRRWYGETCDSQCLQRTFKDTF